MDDREIEILRHFLASLAYRIQKALRDVPDGFGDFQTLKGVRTPKQIIKHVNGVLAYGLTQFTGVYTTIEPLDYFSDEVMRFHEILDELCVQIERGKLSQTSSTEKLLQGPFSDAMTHVGQLALLRRIFGSPIPPENFHDADISAENLSYDQPLPISPDTDWIDADGNDEDPGYD